MLYKINCQHCGGKISFEQDAVNATIPCPHCKQSIPLTPPPAQPVASPAPTSAPAQPEASPNPRTKGGSGKTVVLGALGVVALLAIGVGVFFILHKRPAEPVQPTVEWTVNPENDFTVDPLGDKAKNIVVSTNAQCAVTLRKNFQVATLYFCDVNFTQTKPAPAEVDQIVRDSVEKCAKLVPSQQIIAMAFFSNQPLRKPDYSGPVVWKPEEGAIRSFAESW